LSGDAGNDTLTGGAGTDAMAGGAGDDTYIIGAGDNPTNGSGFAESIEDNQGRNIIVMQGRDQTRLAVLTDGLGQLVLDSSPTDRLVMVAGRAGRGSADRFYDAQAYATSGDDHIDAGTGDDVADDGDDNDTLRRLAGNDVFGDGVVRMGTPESVDAANHGNDVFVGAAGSDNLLGRGGNDELQGGDDNDLHDDQSTLNHRTVPHQQVPPRFLRRVATNDASIRRTA
jgi:Ca2+-binding RTX toxin-like protein